MNAAAWIALVAGIATLITSWAQFVIKERRERLKALPEMPPAATPEVPGIIPDAVSVKRLAKTDWPSFWATFLVQWTLNAVLLFILWRFYRSTSPVTHGSVIAIGATWTFWLIGTLRKNF
jgi:hypothetical protein